MSDHLPECPKNWDVPGDCACEPLRACEQRVRDEDQRILIKHGAEQFVRGEQIGRAMGYAAGLDAAREAVEVSNQCALEALDPLDPQTVKVALAAIDALREGK